MRRGKPQHNVSFALVGCHHMGFFFSDCSWSDEMRGNVSKQSEISAEDGVLATSGFLGPITWLLLRWVSRCNGKRSHNFMHSHYERKTMMLFGGTLMFHAIKWYWAPFCSWDDSNTPPYSVLVRIVCRWPSLLQETTVDTLSIRENILHASVSFLVSTPGSHKETHLIRRYWRQCDWSPLVRFFFHSRMA